MSNELPPPTSPSVLNLRALAGADDPEVVTWMRRFLITLERTDDPISAVRSLGLPTTRKARRLDARNHWLREAARNLPQRNRVALLLAEIRRGKPDTMTALGYCLHNALEAAPLTISERQLRNILKAEMN
jgi:hypothetical protein